MFSGADKQYKLILGLTLGFTLILGILILRVPPSPFPDPSWGFQVMRGMEQGHAFNTLTSPDLDNIAVDKTTFLSWWSPGQYLLPYLFKKLLWLNTGRATALSTILCLFIGLIGYFKLFKRLSFTPIIAAVSVAFIATQNYFIQPYIFYTGGEILLFAFGGWFLYGCFGIEKIDWKAMLFVLVAGFVGFFTKSSFLWIYAAGMACVWINTSIQSKKIIHWLKNGALLAVPFAIAMAVIYLGYLSRGENPSVSEGGLLIHTETFAFPLASPLVSGLSLDELFHGLLFHVDVPLFTYSQATLILVVMTFASLGFLICAWRLIPNKNYALVITALYVVGSLFFMNLYLKQATVSYEGRHYRIIGILAIPGIVYLMSRLKVTRIAFGLIWIAFFCWEAKTFATEYKVNSRSAKGISGFSWQGYEPEVIDELHRLDNADPGKGLFVINNPDIAQEIEHHRVMTLSVQNMDREEFEELKFKGNSGSVYILMPMSYVKNGMATAITNNFVNYKHFEVRQLSKSFYLYSAVN